MMDVRRASLMILLVIVALAAGVVGTLAFYEDIENVTPPWIMGPSHTGVIAAVEGNHLTLNTPNGPMSFLMNETTRVRLMGNVPLRPGSLVKVSYRDVKPDKLAKTVSVIKVGDATAAPPSGAPASGAPASGAPASGAPASGVPASGAPASGAPAAGAP